MAWEVRLSKKARKQLAGFDKSVREKLSAFIERIPLYPHPRSIGKALKGELSGLWRYSLDDYRIICRIHDDELIVEAVKIGHRSKVYKGR